MPVIRLMTSLWSLVQACVWLQFVSKYDHLHTTLLGFVSIMKFCFSHLCNNRQWQIMLLCMVYVPWQNIKSALHSSLRHAPLWWIILVLYVYQVYTHAHHVPHAEDVERSIGRKWQSWKSSWDYTMLSSAYSVHGSVRGLYNFPLLHYFSPIYI